MRSSPHALLGACLPLLVASIQLGGAWGCSGGGGSAHHGGDASTDGADAPDGSAADAPPDAPSDAPGEGQIPICPASMGGSVSAGVWNGPPLSVPMKVTQTSTSGAKRFSIPVPIGDAPALDVFFDTGSSGLRILAGAVPSSAYACVTTTPVIYGYHSGLVLTGVQAYANVTIGGVSTAQPIPVMLVEQVGCDASNPKCGAEGQTPETYTLFGPYKAVFGVGMRNGAASIGSPIAQLPGQPTFLVEGPDYTGTSGTLVLAPSAQQLSPFTTAQLSPLSGGAPLPNGTPAWDDRHGVACCVDDKTSGASFCLPSEWDTGNPPTYVEWPGDTDGGVTILASGDQVEVTLGTASAPLGQYGFTVGAPPTPGIDEIEIEPATGAGLINVGTALFFHYDALFDPLHGEVGLAPHP